MTGIDFGDYLSESERQDIVAEEFREAVRAALSTPNDVERFIGNVAHIAIEGLVDEVLAQDEGTARTLIAEKAATVIRNLSEYTVFQGGDSLLRRNPTLARKLLDQAVTENKGLIEKRVKRIIGEVGRDDVRRALKDAIDGAFENLTEEQA